MTGAAWRIAWRDLWSGRTHFLVAVLSLAAGVAAMNASRALGIEFSRRLNGDMRHWIAADAVVTLRQPPTEEQRAEIAEIARQGIEETDSLEAYSLASSDEAADLAVVSVKSVDPRRYPWYGTLGLEPRRALRDVLTEETAIVSRTLLERLSVTATSRILINGVPFRIAATLTGEPDRFAASPNPYPRIILSEAGFARTQIARRGNAIAWRLLFRTAGAGDIGPLKARLRLAFPDGQIVDYRDHGDARIVTALNAALTYLDLAAWTALLLGSMAVALVIYLHIEQRLDTVAILKTLGGRWRQILAIYLIEITAVSLAGGAIGALLAVPLEQIFPLFAGDQLPFPVTLTWQWTLAGEAVALGVLSSLIATAVPLLAVRSATPLLILRRYVEPKPDGRRLALLVWIASALAMTGLALATLHSWKPGATFLAGLAAAGLILLGLGHGLMTFAGRIARRRHSYSTGNLCRPGRHGRARFLALSAGVMVVTASWLGPAAVVGAIQQSLPVLGADLFVFALGAGQANPLTEALAHDPDVSAPIELLPVVILRLSRIAGAPLSPGTPERWAATCSAAPPGGPLTAGRWWRSDAPAPEAVSSESLATALGAKPGQTLEFFSNGRPIAARLVGLRRLDAIEEQRGGLLFPCSAFAGLSVFYEAAISVKPGRADAVRRRIAARYPSTAIISRAEVTSAIESVAHDALWMLRAVAFLILGAGAAALALMVLADEKTRTHDLAVLKILGARPAQVRNGLLAEFAWLGGLAGASGGLMGSAFATLLLSVVFRKVAPAWDARVFAGAILLGVLTALLAGWAASAATLRSKPLAILRDE